MGLGATPVRTFVRRRHRAEESTSGALDRINRASRTDRDLAKRRPDGQPAVRRRPGQAAVSSHVAVTGTACLSEPSKGHSECATGEPVLFHGFVQRHRLMAVVVAVFVVSLMTSVGCGTATSRTSGPVAGGSMVIVVRDDANGKAVSAKAGDRIELILSSSYWHVTGSSVPSVLRQDGSSVLLSRPSSCPDVPGLGCIPVRADFTALTDGKAAITASRSACGEALRCMPDQTRFTVIVVVRN
jgi:hypothetical protein